MSAIVDIVGREILDSRGNPTVGPLFWIHLVFGTPRSGAFDWFASARPLTGPR